MSVQIYFFQYISIWKGQWIFVLSYRRKLNLQLPGGKLKWFISLTNDNTREKSFEWQEWMSPCLTPSEQFVQLYHDEFVLRLICLLYTRPMHLVGNNGLQTMWPHSDSKSKQSSLCFYSLIITACLLEKQQLCINLTIYQFWRGENAIPITPPSLCEW